MNLFHPRSFSTDWEIMVVDKLDRLVGIDKLWSFAGLLQRECGLNITIDWNTLEFPMGISRSFDQIWHRIRQVTDLATQLVREYDCDLYPAASHPTERIFNASHVHIGTVQDESAALRLEHAAIRYAPVFGALAANSPATLHRLGGFKSLRIRHRAFNNARPTALRDPYLSQPEGGTDTLAKLYGAQTFEMRITDCASSRLFLAEMATFVAAYMHHLGTKPLPEKPSAGDYKRYLTNRWIAARDGMQATFYWDGGPRPVAEILLEMLDDCREELSQLGARASDLVLMQRMIEKRACQADFVLDLARRYPEPYSLASAHAKLVRHWSVFDEFLETAPALDPIPAPDAEEILQIHAAAVGEETHFYRSRETMSYPPPVADEIVEQMVERGLIRRDVVPDRGILLSRLT